MKNFSTLALTLGLLLTVGLACDKFKEAANTSNERGNSTPSSTPANSSSTNSSSNSNSSTSTVPSKAPEKADFTMTSEEFDAEFYKKGVKDKDLEKYANKIIAVSGRVSMLITEKKDTTQPWVTLYAPGTLHGVSCYFDDADVGQMKKLTEGKTAKVQGLQNELVVPEVSPMLQHCTVLEGN